MKEPLIIKVTIIQAALKRYDPQFNLKKIVSLTQKAARQEKPHLILLPNYLLQSGLIPLESELTLALKQVAIENQLYLAGGIAEQKKPGIGSNTAFLISPEEGGGKIESFQEKLHLLPLEKQKLAPGKKLTIKKFLGIKFGCVLCGDIFFPEVCRILALKGAEVILSPSIMAGSHINALELLCRARAVENQVFLVNANAIPLELKGEFPELPYGRSGVYSPFFSEPDLVRGGAEEGFFSALLDLENLRKIKAAKAPTSKNTRELSLNSQPWNLLKERNPRLYISWQARRTGNG